VLVFAVALVAGAGVLPRSQLHADAAQATNVITLTPGPLELAGATRIVDRGPSSDGSGELIDLLADVVDARGGGDGWSLVVTTSAPSMLTILKVTFSCDVASACTLPVTPSESSRPTLVEGGPDTSALVFRASPLSGMGRQTVVLSIDQVVDHSLSAQGNVWSLTLLSDV